MEYAEWQVTHWPHSAASAVSAQNVVIPTRHPILPALTRSLRSASVILTSPPQQDKRARSGSLQLHSAQTLGGGLILNTGGKPGTPPAPQNTARFPVSPQTPFPASPKTPRYWPAPMTVEGASTTVFTAPMTEETASKTSAGHCGRGPRYRALRGQSRVLRRDTVTRKRPIPPPLRINCEVSASHGLPGLKYGASRVWVPEPRLRGHSRETVLERGVAELVDGSCPAQDLAVAGVLQKGQ
jgi:hypothetical protein